MNLYHLDFNHTNDEGHIPRKTMIQENVRTTEAEELISMFVLRKNHHRPAYIEHWLRDSDNVIIYDIGSAFEFFELK